MSAFVIIVRLLWIIRIVANIFSYAHLWWLKEYRFDRMIIHLRTKQGRRIFVIPFHFSHVSLKTILLIIFSAVTLFMLYLLLPFVWWVSFLFIDLLTFPATGLVVFILSVPTILIHQYRILRAMSLLRSHKPMTVIGITGSYGKTSTKEYLTTILSTKYKVLKTAASKNSPIGIAEVILRDLRPETEAFVVEMGAYKRGEIKRMCEMVRPNIAIVTAINPQHQDLFGSIETTLQAKYELIEGLSGKNIAIMNMDNEYVQTMASRAIKDKKNVWSYSIHSKKEAFAATDIQETVGGIQFVVKHKLEQADVSVQVLGRFQAGNITAAIAAAVASGMSLAESAEACKHIKPVEKMMQRTGGVNGSTFINDTFNNNPDAAIAAINYLKTTKGRKILVFQPMVELGKYAGESHEAVGKVAGEVCDEIILTNNNFAHTFFQGAHIFSINKAASYIRNHVQKGDTVLFKGKEAEGVLKKLLSKSP